MKLKKITSLVLAALMVLSMFSMTLVGASAEEQAATVATETVGGQKYETVTIHAGGTPTATGWDTYTTDLTALTASGKKAVTAAGLLIDVAWNKEDLSEAQIKFKWDDADGTLKANGFTDGFYYSADGQTTGKSTINDWLVVPAATFTGTILIPACELNTWATTDYSVFRFALSAGQDEANAHASFSNVRIAWEVADEYPAVNGTYPAMFDSNVGISVTNATHNKWFTALSTGVPAVASDVASIIKSSPKGMMFKMDTGSYSGKVQMTFMMKLMVGDTEYTRLSATPGGAAIDSSGKTVAGVGANSTWYFSKDGQTWEGQSVTQGARRYTDLTVESGTYYVYIPMSDFWTKNGATVLSGGTQTEATEDAVDFETFQTLSANVDYTVSDVKFVWNKTDSTYASIVLSDFVFICDQATPDQPDPDQPNPDEPDPEEPTPEEPTPEEPPVVIVDKAPETLPTTQKGYTIHAINDEYSIPGYGTDRWGKNWQGTDMGIDKYGESWVTSEGIMFKFDASKVPASVTGNIQLGLVFTAGSGTKYQDGDADGAATSTSGKGYYFVTAGMLRYHAGGASTYNGTLAKEQADVTTTWYYSIDGETWNTAIDAANTSRCVTLTDVHTIGYIYIPFSELWCMGPDGQGLYGYRKIGTFDEAMELMKTESKHFKAKNFQFNIQAGLANQTETVFSNFSFAEPHRWNEGVITTPATHTVEGVKTYNCIDCDATKTEAVPTTEEHDGWDEGVITTPATHTAEGVKTFTCTCGETKTEAVPMTEEHEWDDGEVTTPATHTAEGVKTYTCVCGETKTEDVPKTTEHTWGEGVVTTEPTATEDGVKTYTCECGETKTEAIPALGVEEEPDEPTTDAPATDAPATDAPATDAPADDQADPTIIDKVKNAVGCSGVVSGGVGMMILLSGAAVMMTRKKKED